MFYAFANSLIGSFIFTYGIVASNGNTLAVLTIFFLSLLLSYKANVYNPAVTLMELLNGLITTNDFFCYLAG